MQTTELKPGELLLPELTPLQWQIFECGPNSWKYPFRFRTVVAGRRSGKSFELIQECCATAAANPGCEVWYIAPTYRQAKRIAWRLLKKMVPPRLRKKTSEVELSIELINDAMICLHGAENPDHLLGSGLAGICFDEFASMKKEVWTEAVRPMLSQSRGWALFSGTPRGYNHLYDLFEKGMHPDEDEWMSFQFPTAAGGLVDPQEIEDARNDMDARMHSQEYYASFENMGGRAYYNFDRGRNVLPCDDNEQSRVLVGMDFNVNPMAAVIGRRNRNELEIFDEIVLHDSNTEAMSKEIEKRYEHRPLTNDEMKRQERIGRIEGILDKKEMSRSVKVFPDPTCRARKTSAQAGVTDLSILQNHRFHVHCPNRSYPIADRRNTVNALLFSSSGNVRLVIDPKCKHTIKSLQGMMLDETPEELSHVAAALGYLVMGEFSVLNGGVGTQRLLN